MFWRKIRINTFYDPCIKGISCIETLAPVKDVYQKLDIFLDNKPHMTYDFEKNNNRRIELASDLEPGTHELKFVLNEHNIFFNGDITYCLEKPDNHPNCCVRLRTKLSSTEIKEGQGSEIMVKIINRDKEQGVPMTTAIISIPAGLEPRHRQLKDLVDMGTIDYYETKNREVIIFLKEMGPKQTVQFKIDVVASYPGEYIGNASCVYLYYTESEKYWIDALQVNIIPE